MPPPRARPLGGVARGDDLELLDRLERRRREQRDVAADVDVHDAVDEPVHGVAARAVDRNAHRAGQADADFVGEVARHARRQLASFTKLRLLIGSSCTCSDSISVCSAVVVCTALRAGDLDHLADAADRHRRVDREAIVDRQRHAADDALLEAGERKRDFVGPDRQERSGVLPLLVGHPLDGLTGPRVLEDDGDAGQHGAAVVGDGADDGAGGFLGEGARREGDGAERGEKTQDKWALAHGYPFRSSQPTRTIRSPAARAASTSARLHLMGSLL